MIRIFAAVNGRILTGAQNHSSPTYTRIRYLLSELAENSDIVLDAIAYDLLPKGNLISRVYNNFIKSGVVIRTAFRVMRNKPFVFFVYPHTFTMVQYRALFMLCTLLGVQTIVDIHDTRKQASATGDGRKGLSKTIEGYCFRHATIIIALNRLMWEEIKTDYQIKSNHPVIFVPNGFEDDFLSLYPKPSPAREGIFNVCYLGALTRNRGIDILVDACTALHAKYPFLKLYLIGPYGPGIPDDARAAIQQNDYIVRTEVSRDRVPEVLADMDLLVMPYNPQEPYLNFASPTKLYEYIATTKPIICTKCESLMDTGGEGGIMYIDYSSSELARGIEYLILHPDVRERMSHALYTIRKDHTWAERASRIYRGITSLSE
jgi:glycosyltransferase involved in cell wall biosynthesis